MLVPTVRLLGAYSLGSIASIAGTIVAFTCCSIKALGLDAGEAAYALCAFYWGRVVNYGLTLESAGLPASV